MLSRRRLLVLTASIALSGCRQGSRKAKLQGEAPAFTLQDVQGRSVQLADYKGKVVALNFWATNCAPCRYEIPWLIEFERKYKDRGFAVLGIAMDDDGWESVKPFIEKRKVNYRVLSGTFEVADLYGGVSSIPTTFMIDRAGRIANSHIGLVSKSDMEREIEELLTGMRRPDDKSDAKPSGSD